MQLQQENKVAKSNLLRKCGLLVIGNTPLRKTTQIRFGKAGAHPQLAWESQLPLKPYLSLQPLYF